MSTIEAAKTGAVLICTLGLMMILHRLGVPVTGVGFAVTVLIDQEL